jgi:hypothetical protein
VIKIRAEINEIERKRAIQRIIKTKSWFFEKINKIDRPLIKMRRENTQFSKIRNAKGKITPKPRKSRESSESFRTYIQINLEILKKWTNF